MNKIKNVLQKMGVTYFSARENFKKRYPLINTILILFAMVMLWRGIWGVLDLYLFPENQLLSYVASIGIALFIILFDDFKLTEV